MPLSIYLLSLCNAFMFICASLLITISALIGYDLAPEKAWATMPMAVQFFAMMCASIPASLLMARIGRKHSFMLGAVIGFFGACLALWSIFNHNFWAFCLSTFCFGTFSAFGNYYRFTAPEVVPADKRNLAISYVMAGGVIAAFIGPNLANWSQHIFAAEQYAGAFAVLMFVYFLSFVTIAKADLPPAPLRGISYQGRPLSVIMAQPAFIVAVVCEMLGYGTMNLVMTSTPLAMHAVNHGLGDTAFVIQWHVVAMFAPSFFTGHLINRIGMIPVLSLGALFGVVCVLVNLSGTTVTHFAIALALLGVCWNFLFVGGTTLLTSTYRPEEKARTQAANDFLVFTTVSITALSAGGIHHLYGWEMVNLSVLPLLFMAGLSVMWLFTQRQMVEA